MAKTSQQRAVANNRRRLAERGPEGPAEMGGRDDRDGRQRRDVQGLPVSSVHGVACAQHAAIGFLDRLAHGPMTPYPGGRSLPAGDGARRVSHGPRDLAAAPWRSR